MSKQDNLTDFLTDVADAIREKKGTTDKINPQNFSEEIRGIESGGVVEKEYKDVNFFDYDGTILFSYTWEEAEQLTEMPTPPANLHKGLLFEGWNYTLEEMKAQGDYADIGALYMTDNGRTKLIGDYVGETTLYLKQSKPHGITIYWGDGTHDISGEDLTFYISHHYENPVSTTIELESVEGSDITLNATYLLIKEINAGDNLILNQCFAGFTKCTKLSMNTGVRLGSVGLSGARLLYFVSSPKHKGGNHYAQSSAIEGISLHPNISINSSTFNGVSSLRRLVIPATKDNTYDTSLTDKFPLALSLRMAKNSPNPPIKVEKNTIMLGDKVFKGCMASEIPSYATSIGDNVFQDSYIGSISIPDSVTSIGASAFYGAKNIEEIIAPNVGGVLNQTFRNCPSLKKVVLGDIAKIEYYVFYYASTLQYVDLRRCSSVPILSDTGSFSSSGNYKIVVPDALYDEWIDATNWSSFARRIVKASEFVEPTTE